MIFELEKQVEEHKEIKDSLALLVQELKALRQAALKMKDVYAQAALSNDLTFITIIGGKYELLSEQLYGLIEQAYEEQCNLEQA